MKSWVPFPPSSLPPFHSFSEIMATRPDSQNGGPEFRTQLYLKAAEFFLQAKNFDDCRKNASRAQALDPIHPGPTQLLAIAAVISASSSSAAAEDGASPQRPDYYSILGVPRFTGDLHLIETRVEKLCAILNPRENHYALAEEAYRLVVEAWLVLSIPTQRAVFDEELKMKPKFGNGSGTQSFWTMCPYCYYVYEYPMVFKECCMRCQNEKCRRAFHGVAIPPPPPDVVAMGKFSCPGFMPIRVGGNGMDSWTPFAPIGLGAFAETGTRNENERKGDGLAGNGEHGDKFKFPNQAFGRMDAENENGNEKLANDVNRAAKSHNVEMNWHDRDQRMKTRHDSDHRMETDGGNVGMKKQKMVAKSTKKLMGKGVRIQVINAVPLDSTADDRASGYTYNGKESELISGKLEFFEEGDDICVGFHPGFD